MKFLRKDKMVEALNYMEEREAGLDFVGLKMPDEMPVRLSLLRRRAACRKKLVEGGNLVARLLDIVFAEVCYAGAPGLKNLVSGNALAYRHELYGGAISPGTRRGPVNARAHCFDIGGDLDGSGSSHSRAEIDVIVSQRRRDGNMDGVRLG